MLSEDERASLRSELDAIRLEEVRREASEAEQRRRALEPGGRHRLDPGPWPLRMR